MTGSGPGGRYDIAEFPADLAFLRGIISDEFYAVDYAQDSDADDSYAVNRAIAQLVLSPSGKGVILLPFGPFTKTTASPGIQLVSNISIIGGGMGATTIDWDDSDGVTSNQLFIGGTSLAHLTNVTLSGFTVIGRLATSTTARYHAISISYVDGIEIDHVEVQYSRLFSVVANHCTNVNIHHCVVYRGRHDGIAIWNSTGSVVDNVISQCGDDAISAHTDDTETAPVRAGVFIARNRITACNGIKSLGARNVQIKDNILQRVHSYAFFIGTDTFAEQGSTPEISVEISGGTVNDVLFHPQAANGYHSYLVFGGLRRSAGSLNSAPGQNYTTGANVTALFGTSGIGNMNGNDVDDSATVPSPGSYGINVHDIICQRTLPSASAYSNWGFGSIWCINALIDPAVTAANLTPLVGIKMTEAMRNVVVHDCLIANTIVALKAHPLSTSSPTALAFQNVLFHHMRFFDFSTAGYLWDPTTPTSPQDIVFEDCLFDGDPLLAHANRGANGTWAASGAPVAVDMTKMKGGAVKRSTFKNVCRLFLETTANDNLVDDNTVRCQPATNIGTFSTSNKGVGLPINGGGAWKYAIENSDPATTGFGQVLYFPSPNQRTNLIRNNSGQGGSAGVTPTNWSMPGTQNGLTWSIIGVGVENGIDYVDVRVVGTSTSSSSSQLIFESTTQLAGAKGEVFTASSFRKLAAGATTNVSRIEDFIQELAAGSAVANRALNSASLPTSAALASQRQSYTTVMGDATTTTVRSGVLFVYGNGAVIDITMRIGLPQFERGAVATSPIRTTSAAVTKAANGAFEELKELLTAV